MQRPYVLNLVRGLSKARMPIGSTFGPLSLWGEVPNRVQWCALLAVEYIIG